MCTKCDKRVGRAASEFGGKCDDCCSERPRKRARAGSTDPGGTPAPALTAPDASNGGVRDSTERDGGGGGAQAPAGASDRDRGLDAMGVELDAVRNQIEEITTTVEEHDGRLSALEAGPRRCDHMDSAGGPAGPTQRAAAHPGSAPITPNERPVSHPMGAELQNVIDVLVNATRKLNKLQASDFFLRCGPAARAPPIPVII